ncbi:MAG: hypothetical protein QMD71_09735, partial [bacterium]|nr:hypothetical protein [bacterium]
MKGILGFFVSLGEVVGKKGKEERMKFLSHSFKGRCKMLKRSGNPALAGKKCVSMKASPLRAQARRVGMIVLALILAIPAIAGEIVKELKFNTADLEFS